jgi:hypothetical protein
MVGVFALHGEYDMSSRWWYPSPFDRMEELSFKPIPEGWIFRPPKPWLFGPGHHYLINEVQKSELSIHLRQMLRVFERGIMIIVIVGVAIVVPLAPVLNEHPAMSFAGLVVGAVAAGFVAGHLAVTHMYRAVQPLMAGLQPTTQRSTQGILDGQLAVYSRGRLGYHCLSSLVMFAVVASLSSRHISSGWNLFSLLGLFGTIMLGSGTIYWFVLYIAKVKSER